MMGESKYDVLRLVPEEVKPKTVLIKLPSSREQVLAQMKEAGLTFPVIFKPDLGERGWLVNRIDQEQDVDNYLTKIPVDFIIQELVDLPLEFGVYYIRLPNEERGVVTSITAKEFLRVEGDGCKTLAQLIWEKDRAKLQWHVLKRKFAHQWDRVIPASEKVELVSIGNHCLGTMFLNGNHLITPKLNSSFDALSKRVDGFYFGRYDLRCASLADLEQGNVMVVELNGCGAEPAHIYQPGASLLEALRVLHQHWIMLYRVSKINHQRGVAYLSFPEGRRIYKHTKALLGRESGNGLNRRSRQS